MWNRKVFVRIIEVLLCISCIIALRVTDDESKRVFHYLRNRNREWFLLNNVTWGTIGTAFATAVCGGYVIITAGLLMAAATGELRGRWTEIFLLGTGVILFGIVGALSLASIESVPSDLVDNAAVLGALALATALVFIIDMFMSPRTSKKKHGETQTFTDKDIVKYPVTTTLTTEKEVTKTPKSPSHSSQEPPENINVNNGYDDSSDRRRGSIDKTDYRGRDPEDDVRRSRSADRDRDRDRDRGRDEAFLNEERQIRGHEYVQNVENGRSSRKYQREPDLVFENGYSNRRHRKDDYYRNSDIYQRPVDEVDDDTPPFPNENALFKKMPSVKIMRVDRDDGFEGYRYSDSSQYDNVPTRARGSSSPGILKKQRDVSFSVPRNSYRQEGRHRDEIEMLEECFDALRTTTGTQTAANKTPSSPNDPGYVRHTASNWPRDLKAKTPGTSPQHS